jgi:hypothetical protein
MDPLLSNLTNEVAKMRDQVQDNISDITLESDEKSVIEHLTLMSVRHNKPIIYCCILDDTEFCLVDSHRSVKSILVYDTIKKMKAVFDKIQQSVDNINTELTKQISDISKISKQKKNSSEDSAT